MPDTHASHSRGRHTEASYDFASDNTSGICPEAWEAMQAANVGHCPSYGDDAWTARAADRFRELFEADCEVFFAFNGTAANSLALAAMCQSYHSVICTEASHVETDECGAPEFFSNGSKLLTVPAPDGKLTPDAIRAVATRRSDIHFPKPRAVTVTQPTETGRVHTLDELRAIADTAHDLSLRVHMDGSRFANACVCLGCTPAEMSWRAGIDVLCFGGAKNGMAIGEAILFFDHALSEDFEYRCKQAGQLASKMRFLTAPWLGMLEGDAWLRHAGHANDCARRFSSVAADLPGVRLMFPTEANGVFLRADEAVLDALRARGWRFYNFIGGAARFMFGWDSDPAQVDRLGADLADLARAAARD